MTFTAILPPIGTCNIFQNNTTSSQLELQENIKESTHLTTDFSSCMDLIFTS